MSSWSSGAIRDSRYLLVAICFPRIYQRYKEQVEAAIAEDNDAVNPRPLVITIEEAHKSSYGIADKPSWHHRREDAQVQRTCSSSTSAPAHTRRSCR
jgi:hypothetical protein